MQPVISSVRLGSEAELGEEQHSGGSSGRLVSEVSLFFERWCPASQGRQAAPQPLRLALDGGLSQSALRVHVIGSQAGSSFAVPSVFQAEGRELSAATSIEQQRLEYIARHRAKRGGGEQRTELGPSESGDAGVAGKAAASGSSTVTVASGV